MNGPAWLWSERRPLCLSKAGYLFFGKVLIAGLLLEFAFGFIFGARP